MTPSMIEPILLRLQMWSFWVLPLTGFVIGHLLQFLLGTKHNSKYESLVVHIITVAMMTIIFIESTSGRVREDKDRVLFVSISYLFVLGVVLGVISVLY